MKEFKRFYVFGMSAKLYMGIYFVALVFVVGLITAAFGGDSLKLLTLVSIFVVCMILGFTQEGFLSGENYEKNVFTRRTVIWLIGAVVLVIAAAELFGWLAGLPGWCVPVLGAFMTAGFVAMFIGIRWEQEMDTHILNEGLERYRQSQEK